MKYYYKDANNNFYALKSPKWRTDEERTKKELNENDEEVITLEDYTQAELDLQAQYTQITEQEFNEHQASLHYEPTAEQIALQEKQKEMAQIKQWLNEHDYIINKHLLGEYTDNDERWLNYLAERKIKLDRYNELEK